MTIEYFEEVALIVGVGGLILYMLFIMYKLGRESGAGRFGRFIIFLGLGLGIAGFAVKSGLQLLIQV